MVKTFLGYQQRTIDNVGNGNNGGYGAGPFDLDGDGNQELVAMFRAGGSGARVDVLEFDGDNNLIRRNSITVNDPGPGTHRVERFNEALDIGDVDNDGRPEIVFGYNINGASTILWVVEFTDLTGNNFTMSVDPIGPIPVPSTLDNPTALKILGNICTTTPDCDANNPEIIVGWSDENVNKDPTDAGSITVHEYVSGSWVTHYNASPVNNVASMAFGNTDGDASIEIGVLESDDLEDENDLYIFEWDSIPGSRTLTKGANIANNLDVRQASFSYLFFEDFDDDNINELVVGHVNHNTNVSAINVYENVGGVAGTDFDTDALPVTDGIWNGTGTLNRIYAFGGGNADFDDAIEIGFSLRTSGVAQAIKHDGNLAGDYFAANFSTPQVVFDVKSSTNQITEFLALPADGTNGDQDAYPDIIILTNQASGTIPETFWIEKGAKTLYSTTSGNFEDMIWTESSDGTGTCNCVPDSLDNIIIRGGDEVVIDAIDDNGYAGISPDGLPRSNVGTFNNSGTTMFYHSGDITVKPGGELNLDVPAIFDGTTTIESAGIDSAGLNSSSDLVILDFLEVKTGATMNTLDDLILSGNSSTFINGRATMDDDFYLDHTDAFLCGTGVAQAGRSSSNFAQVQFLNGATDAQICTSLTIECLAGGNCGLGNLPLSGTTAIINGIDGPGGVGGVDGDTQLVLWLDADDLSGTLSDNDPVTLWSDLSGYANEATATGPIFRTNQYNGFPTLSFDGTDDYMTISNDPDLNPSEISIVFAGAINDFARTLVAKTNEAGTLGYELFYDSNLIEFFVNSTANSISGAYTPGSKVIIAVIFDGSDIYLYLNGSLIGSTALAASINNTTGDLLLGAAPIDAGGQEDYLNGNISELSIYSQQLNDAERILVENYLASKYDITLLANNVYTEESNGYFTNLAGVGQAVNSTFNLGGRAASVSFLDPDDLDDNEFLAFAHDGANINTTNEVDVDGLIIESRLERTWAVTETGGDVGNVKVIFDLNTLSSLPLGSDIRLLIDRDGDGFADNDVAPIVGSFSNGNMIFSNVNFQDGDIFTIGSTNATDSPLPLELISLKAEALLDQVIISWSSASELNTDKVVIERSGNGNDWLNIGTVTAAGNSTEIKNYKFSDQFPLNGINYYRLKTIDLDGSSEKSWIVSAIFRYPDHVIIGPNPFGEHINIRFKEAEEHLIYVRDLRGQIVYMTKTNKDACSISTGFLPQGMYMISILKNEIPVKQARLIRK